MSRKHYIFVADILANARKNGCTKVADEMTVAFADWFASDNDNFDRQKFYAAAGMNS